ncbi:MAG: beta-Ala-His dipeptidase, partial [Spirochaetota bacterium]
LQDDAVQTGKLECLFTVEEEIGLNGALGLEPSMISGRMLVNLDTEEVGAVYIGCAGGKDSYISRQMNQVPPGSGKTAIKLEITSLRGGHSGAEIHKGRANALVLMARTLNQLRKKFTYHISSIRGGDKHNAIPREAFSEIVVDSREAEGVQGLFQEYCCKLKNEYSPVEDQMAFRAEPAPVPQLVFDSPSTALMANVLMCIPHGVVAMSRVMEGLVETSTNFAYLRTHGGLLDIHLNHRSSIDSALERVCDIHACITRMANAHIEHKHGYPGWTPDPQSRLLEHARRAVRNVTGKDAVVRATHAGLECGVIKSKFQDMEAVSIGPTIRSPHSPDEKLEIASVEVFWNILVQTLKEIAQ